MNPVVERSPSLGGMSDDLKPTYVEAGGFVTVLPEDMARFLISGKSLKIIPLKGVEVAHTVGLVAPYREPHTPVLGTLLREAKQMSAA